MPEGPKAVITKLMVKDPEKRATAEMILQDDWVQGHLKGQSDITLSPKAIENMKIYWVFSTHLRTTVCLMLSILLLMKGKSEFYYQMMTLFSIEFMKPEFFQSLMEKYKQMDANNTGALPKKELIKSFLIHNTSSN